MRPLGLEPKTYGLKVRPAVPPTPDAANTSGDADSVLADCLAFLAEKMPDLAAVIEAWPTLPDPIRTGILAMVQATMDPRQP